jgi:hypothetical protein
MDGLLMIGLGEASRDPAAWLHSMAECQVPEEEDDLDEMNLDHCTNGFEFGIQKWGFSIGRPESWIPGLWGALLLTRVDPCGVLADWNDALQEEVQKGSVDSNPGAVYANSIIWRVDGVCNDSKRMAAMLLDESREGIVLQFRNPES